MFAVGPGPVYALADVGETSARLHIPAGSRHGRWLYVSQKWIGGPQYQGPILIRARRLSGASSVQFLFSTSTVAEEPTVDLWFPAGGPAAASGWRAWGVSALVERPGCYVYQVDGLSFSETIVLSLDVQEPR